MTNSKLKSLVSLSILCDHKLSMLKKGPLDQTGERALNDILDNLKEIKDLIPLLESDIKALSSL